MQHFADLGVYKHLKKKTHLTKDVLFPHLPGHPEGVDPRKVSKIYFSFLSMFNGIGVIDIAWYLTKSLSFLFIDLKATLNTKIVIDIFVQIVKGCFECNF